MISKSLLAALLMSVAALPVLALDTKNVKSVSAYNICVQQQVEWVEAVDYVNIDFAKEVLSERVANCKDLKNLKADSRAATLCTNIGPAFASQECLSYVVQKSYGNIDNCQKAADRALLKSEFLGGNSLQNLNAYTGAIRTCLDKAELAR